MRRKRVYIAAPYSRPDPLGNTVHAMHVWDHLWVNGYAPFCPHWSHWQHLYKPRSYEEWLEYDNCFLPCCDAVLRLAGESAGADGEVALAESLGIPVYQSVADLFAGMPAGGVG